MVANVPSARYLFVPSLFHAQRSGRTQVPVRPSDSIYAHFDHVEGIPSRNNTIPLIKLRIIDELISRLAGNRQAGVSPEAGAKTAASATAVPYGGGKAVPPPLYSMFLSPRSEPGALLSVYA